MATLLCVFGFVVCNRGLNFTRQDSSDGVIPAAIEANSRICDGKAGLFKKDEPAAAAPTPTLEQRRATNAKELERLHGVEEQLKLRKRDLLHSDTEGNRLYAIDLASYNDALAKATTEKNALASAK